MTYGTNTGYGRGKPDFWIGQDASGETRAISPVHVCFAARSRAEVDAFHAAGLAAGGRDNGGPGLRPQYHPNYYGAFGCARSARAVGRGVPPSPLPHRDDYGDYVYWIGASGAGAWKKLPPIGEGTPGEGQMME